MKKVALLFLLIQTGMFAQNSKSCYTEYYSLFQNRGAQPVTDGLQNVIVTFRDTKANTCVAYQGQILVKNGELADKLKLKNTAGEYVNNKDNLNQKYHRPEKPMVADLKIENGMTKNFLSGENKTVNLFFIDFLNKPEPSIIEAPDVKKL